MKIEFEDYLWAIMSVIIIGGTYMGGHLIMGVIIVYVLMAVVFYTHILKLRKKMDGSIAVFGTVSDYHEEHKRNKLYYPVLDYTTEDGREVSSVYYMGSRKMKYEIGSEQMICYDPDDPTFFYFSDNEEELANRYYLYILAGGIAAALICLGLYMHTR